jgi:fermentation-respiration switch protein FrsA (DUF1100 family)
LTGVVRGLALSALCALILGVLWVNIIERFIFFPDAVLVGTPASVSLPFEDVEFAAADGTMLHGWWVRGHRAETLLWFHGNAGNISHRLDNLRLLHDAVGASVFLFDYRQYGRSAGSASERGLYDDARGALAFLKGRPEIDPTRLVYFGRSLGSAVAVDLAVTHPPAGLILETPFASIREMARRWLPGPLSALVPQQFDNLGKIGAIRSPTLFIHGDQDDLVPYPQGQQLFEAAAEPKTFFTIPGAGHNDTYLVGGSDYFRKIAAFCDSLPVARPADSP